MTGPVLIVIDRPPYGEWQGREALDMAFSLAAFDRPVDLLFRGPGVNWLRPGQNGAAIHQKTVSRNLGAARMFGVQEVFADRQGLAQSGIETTEPETCAITPNAEFYQQYAQVIQL